MSNSEVIHADLTLINSDHPMAILVSDNGSYLLFVRDGLSAFAFEFQTLGDARDFANHNGLHIVYLAMGGWSNITDIFPERKAANLKMRYTRQEE